MSNGIVKIKEEPNDTSYKKPKLEQEIINKTLSGQSQLNLHYKEEIETDKVTNYKKEPQNIQTLERIATVECSSYDQDAGAILYSGHEIKGELVIGPEIIHRPTPTDVTKDAHQENNKKPFKCEECCQEFTFENNLQVHKRLHNVDKRFKCAVCLRNFTKASTFDLHKKSHPRPRRFACPVCNKLFTLKNVLDNHLRVHSGEKPFTCDICKVQFRQKAHLHDHVKSHDKSHTRYFPCEQCDRRFSRRGNLHRHLVTHQKARTVYRCDLCDVVFKQKAMMVRHNKKHIKRRSYSCEKCEKTFYTAYNMNVHRKFIHKIEVN